MIQLTYWRDYNVIVPVYTSEDTQKRLDDDFKNTLRKCMYSIQEAMERNRWYLDAHGFKHLLDSIFDGGHLTDDGLDDEELINYLNEFRIRSGEP